MAEPAALQAGLTALQAAPADATGLLLRFLLPHAAASALLSFGATRVFPARYRRPGRWLFAAIFGFVFFLPVIGPLVVGLGALINLLFPRLFHQPAYDGTSVPAYQLSRETGIGGGSAPRGGDARARLRNPATPIGGRLQALMSMSGAPARVTGRLLREMLADPVEDMRLLAYGMMEKREQAVSRRLVHQQQLLAQASGTRERRSAARRVAELYWELVYQDLVQGDMAVYALDEARSHAQQALSGGADPAGDGPLQVLLARIALRQERLADAAQALRAAADGGIAQSAVLPYLAELHFLQGEYGRVRQVVREMAAASGAVEPARRYWSRRLAPGAIEGGAVPPAAGLGSPLAALEDA
jgi:hypothetical protein